jgi:hypothetical protein
MYATDYPAYERIRPRQTITRNNFARRAGLPVGWDSKLINYAAYEDNGHPRRLLGDLTNDAIKLISGRCIAGASSYP